MESKCKYCDTECGVRTLFLNSIVLECDDYKMAVSFSVALKELKEGKQVARKGWNGKGMWIELQVPTVTSKMHRPYLYISSVDGELVPWVASQTDLLAEDWIVL